MTFYREVPRRVYIDYIDALQCDQVIECDAVTVLFSEHGLVEAGLKLGVYRFRIGVMFDAVAAYNSTLDLYYVREC